MPHITEPPASTGARAGESPSVERLWKEQWTLYQESVSLARRSLKAKNEREIRKNAAAGKLFEIARKALDSCYAAAKDRELPEILSRYESLAKFVTGKGGVSNRRAHQGEREN